MSESLRSRIKQWKGWNIMLWVMLLSIFGAAYVMLLLHSRQEKVKVAAPPAKGVSQVQKDTLGFRVVNDEVGLVGRLYDLKQDKDRKETDVKNDGVFTALAIEEYKKRGENYSAAMWDEIMGDRSPLGKRADLVTPGFQNHGKVVSEFLNKDWDESVLKRYYMAQDSLTAFQFYIPYADPTSALKAFGVEKEIKPTHFVIHYKGYVKAPRDGEFRFRSDPGTSQCGLYIRYDGMNVLGTPQSVFHDMSSFRYPPIPGDKDGPRRGVGRWFRAEAGKRVPVEFLLENGPSGLTAMVFIEERSPEKPYPLSLISQIFPQFGKYYAYPVFAVKKGVPLPPRTTREKIEAQKPPTNNPSWRPSGVTDYGDPLVFEGCK